MCIWKKNKPDELHGHNTENYSYFRQEECVGGARLLLVGGGRVITAWPGPARSGLARPGPA